ncbi:hypothetical protein cyc_08334 [Cyclospora cayetanensis]|uniref:Uncharacterized protein n=1 Tax=Cyclospora cayetanensis TaxID=88456 RepID=A0A1D3CS84_9EIME|nr:hypothetical protein cyc_08334 [Cyclospora cayetanensis]
MRKSHGSEEFGVEGTRVFLCLSCSSDLPGIFSEAVPSSETSVAATLATTREPPSAAAAAGSKVLQGLGGGGGDLLLLWGVVSWRTPSGRDASGFCKNCAQDDVTHKQPKRKYAEK